MASFLLPGQPRFDLSAARLPASRNLSKSAAGNTTIWRVELPIIEDIFSFQHCLAIHWCLASPELRHPPDSCAVGDLLVP